MAMAVVVTVTEHSLSTTSLGKYQASNLILEDSIPR
jgi:hypothetical protein